MRPIQLRIQAYIRQHGAEFGVDDAPQDRSAQEPGLLVLATSQRELKGAELLARYRLRHQVSLDELSGDLRYALKPCESFLALLRVLMWLSWLNREYWVPV